MPSESIPLCVPAIGGNEWAYLKECLDTTFVSSVGPFVDRFEREVAARVGTRFGVATASGTAALHTALMVAGVKPEDEVLVSTLTFIAPANAVRYAGAWPVFIDAEPEYWQMDPEKVKTFLERDCVWKQGALLNKATGRRVRALLPVHVLGHPVDMDPMLELARKYNLLVIEDATECLGAAYKGRATGHLGDIACFSFNGNKIITTGGGGMIVTDREDWASRGEVPDDAGQGRPGGIHPRQDWLQLSSDEYPGGDGLRPTGTIGQLPGRQARDSRALRRGVSRRERVDFHARSVLGQKYFLDVHGAGGRGRIRPGQPRAAEAPGRRTCPGTAAVAADAPEPGTSRGAGPPL